MSLRRLAEYYTTPKASYLLSPVCQWERVGVRAYGQIAPQTGFLSLNVP